MFLQSYHRALALSLASLTLAIVATSAHHVFRLGSELVPVTLLVFVTPLVLMALYVKTKHRTLLIAYGIYTTLIVTWFGFLDGFMDHVLKALGIQNLTFLPGSDAEVVATVYSLWSPEATDAFYEGSGVLTFLLSVFTVIYTHRFIRREFRSGHVASTRLVKSAD